MNLLRLSRTAVCLTACFLPLASDAHAEIAVSVTPDLITEKLNDELQSRMEQIYVNSNESLLRVNGWIDPCFGITGVVPIESAHSARGLVTFEGTVSFSSLAVQFGVLRRRVSGRLGLSGNIEISADENSLTVGNICWNPSVQCLASNGPILNHLLRKRSIQRSILRNVTKRASHTLASYSGNINNTYLDFRDDLLTMLGQIPTIQKTFKLKSSDASASIVFSAKKGNAEPVSVLFCGDREFHEATADKIVCKISDTHDSRQIVVLATQAAANRLYRAAVGELPTLLAPKQELYTNTTVLNSDKAVAKLRLADDSPLVFEDAGTSERARVHFKIADVVKCGDNSIGKQEIQYILRDVTDPDQPDDPSTLVLKQSMSKKLKALVAGSDSVANKIAVGDQLTDVDDIALFVEKMMGVVGNDNPDRTASLKKLKSYVDSKAYKLGAVDWTPPNVSIEFNATK